MKRLSPSHLKAILHIARSSEALSLSEVAGIILVDSGFTRTEASDILGQQEERSTSPKNTHVQASRSMNKKGSAWTAKEDDMIVGLWAEGFTTSQIAKKMQRTTGSLSVRISHLRKIGSSIPLRNAGTSARMKSYRRGKIKTAKK